MSDLLLTKTVSVKDSSNVIGQLLFYGSKEIFRRLADYRLESKAVRKGTLVSYQDVVSASGGVASGCELQQFMQPVQ